MTTTTGSALYSLCLNPLALALCCLLIALPLTAHASDQIILSGSDGSEISTEHKHRSEPGSASLHRNPVPDNTTKEQELEAFSFALIGDLPYGDAQIGPFEKIIDDVNADTSIQFVVHVGDIKSGNERCDDHLIKARFGLYQRFKSAFIYTPGDNEWTDCHRKSNGSYHPLERLQFLRKTFFPVPTRSTGGSPKALLSQSQTEGFDDLVENTLFIKNQVVFATVHVVGANNNLAPWKGLQIGDTLQNPTPERMTDFNRRRNAALAWLNETFELAKMQNARGIFIFMHANPRFGLSDTDRRVAGFLTINRHLQRLSADYARPVVLAHGDYHRFIADKPFAKPRLGPSAPNFTRLQSLGGFRVGWVKVTVEPASENFFTYDKQSPER